MVMTMSNIDIALAEIDDYITWHTSLTPWMKEKKGYVRVAFLDMWGWSRLAMEKRDQMKIVSAAFIRTANKYPDIRDEILSDAAGTGILGEEVKSRYWEEC